jgi:hypothetical protein
MKGIKTLLLISTLSLSLTAYAATTDNTNGSNGGSSNTSNGGSNSSNIPDISGKYDCHGYDPFGKSNYKNPVTVTKNGDTYSFQWLNSRNYPFILGTGVMNPDINNMVSVVFWDPKKADYFGTEVFAIKPDGSMSATWTVQGENQVGTEECVKK